jgi:pyruvate-formate lyase-activating enzyme
MRGGSAPHCAACPYCSNPEYRKQLEDMLAQQAASTGSPAVAEMMQGMDMSPEKVGAGRPTSDASRSVASRCCRHRLHLCYCL